MKQLVVRLFGAQYMVRPERVVGPMPATKEAYLTNFNIAWPSALEAFLVALIASVDTIMVGTLGPEAISAVGITTQPKFLVLSAIVSLNIGVTTIVARRKGEDNRQAANRCLMQGVLLSIILALLIGAIAFVWAEPILVFAGAGSDILADSVLYFRIILVGNFFFSVSLTINAAQRGVGNTRISMFTNLTANGINLIFNFLLIGGHLGFPRWGVMGAAVATALGNIVAFVMSFYSIVHRDGFLRFRLDKLFSWDGSSVSAIFRISSGALVEQVFMRLGFLTYAKIVAGLGTIAFASHQICMNMLSISFSFGDGLSIASSALVGQNLGARRPDLAILYGKIGQRMALAVSGLLCIIFITCRYPLVSIFNDDPLILSLSSPLMIIAGISCLAQVSQVVFAGCLRGAGDILYVTAVSFVSIAVVRPILSWVLCYPLGLGLTGAWLGLFVDQFSRLIFTAIRFSGGRWTEIKI